MSWNDLYSFRAALPISEIDKMRTNIRHNIAELNLKRHLMLPNDFTLLMNHHQYILNLYNNMINSKKVEQSDPYSPTYDSYLNNQGKLNPYQGKKTVVYNPDGTTQIVGEGELSRTNEEWESQFDSSLLLNPPSYIHPPNNVWNIRQVKRMSESQNTLF